MNKEAEIASILEEAMAQIIKCEPATTQGQCYYEMHDIDGNFIGTQPVDPLAVVQEMSRIAQESREKVWRLRQQGDRQP